MSKKNKLPARKKIALELLHHILGHRFTRLLLARDTENVLEDVEIRIYPDPFCTSCQISLMKKVIVHATTAKIMMTIRYTHLWHECLAMTNAKVKIMVTVCN